MRRLNHNQKFKKSFTAILLLAILFSGFVALRPQPAQAFPVEDIPALVWQKIQDFFKTGLKKVASKTLQSVIQKTLNRVAIDAATYIGSGGRGQQPLFVTKGWGEYAKDLADNAAGEFIGNLNEWAFTDANGKPMNINLCEPSLDIKGKIGLGLTDYTAPGAGAPSPVCTFSRMKEAWTSEINKYKDMSGPDFLKKMANMFDPTGSDLSVSLTLMSRIDDIKAEVKNEKGEEVKVKKGWLDVKNIGGKTAAPPGNSEDQAKQAKDLQNQNLGKVTGDALVDAANVFLNKLALTAFNSLMSKIGELGNKTDDSTGPNSSVFGGLLNPDYDPLSNRSSLVLQNQLNKILRPRFDSPGDYDVLAQLTICPGSNIGPTDCVIDEQFRQAIEDRQTVAESLKAGYLNGSWRFRREIDANQGYSLRSISILRKYRILPVGWETALLKAEALNQPATLTDFVSCFDANDNYSEFSQGFVPGAWCQGLVDPNWVLKAPLNYCKRQGPGGQILDKTFISKSVDPNDPNNILSPAQVIVTRADNYCADEQSCIKEKSDGTCEAYGYCTEEKRTWNFGTDGCDPVYNTCKSFTKDNTTAKVAYLENTVDYSTCTSDNVGCKPYSLSGIYSTSTNFMDWKPLQQIYFNKQVETCDKDSESCQEFIRIKSNLGHNILINSDFESSLDRGGWDVFNATSTVGGYYSDNALQLNAALSRNINVGPNDYNVAGQAYTLSFYAKSCDVGDQYVLGGVNNDITGNLSTSTDWNYYSSTYVFPENVNTNQVHIAIDSSTCLVDKLKLELSTNGTAYSDYGTGNFVYQKLIPNYLEQYCYVNPFSGTKDFSLKTNAPASCNNFTRKCNASEVGCDRFTADDGFVVAAKASASDYCSSECIGYDTYIQKETNFQNKTASNLIPKTGVKCSATAAGCSEFTNLDQLAQGGEAKEYYVSLRQCIKPDDAQCDVFYSWGNPGDGGYQLVAYTLKSVNNNPYTIINDSASCNAAIYNLPADHPAYNSDCRQFYNQAGQVSYHLYSNTISCSDNCHPYRLSDKPVDTTINQANCTNDPAKHWDNNNQVCYVCRHGGVWDGGQDSCVYQAIPGEGQSCSASENGCREYNGNYGNNVQNIAVFNFEGQNDNWFGLCSDASVTDANSLNKNGHSLKYTSGGQTCPLNSLPPISQAPLLKRVGVVLKNLWNNIAPTAWAQDPLPTYGVAKKLGMEIHQGGSYTVKFLAKANQNVSLKIKLTNGVEAQAFNVTSQNSSDINIFGNGQWQLYQANLENLEHETTEQESIVFSATGNFWFDNVVITEITDRYYLIKDSWRTPDVCYYDTLGNYQGANYNLGCAAYRDRDNSIHNLRHFTKLCGEQSVGCELLIDTRGSADYNPVAFNETAPNNNICDGADGADCVSVPADQMIYAIVDPNKGCNSTDKGCTRLGQQQSFNPDVAVQNLYSDVYVKNNPNRYDTILCRSSESGCDAWAANDGQVSYFRDPGNNVCEWREPKQSTGMNLPKKWYKRPIKRCDLDGNNKINISQSGLITEAVNKLCVSDSDCVVNGLIGSCILDENDYLCPVDYMKTIGFGGAGNKVYQPQGMIGTCATNNSGCSEYIDPVSEFSPNMIVNPDWGDTNKDGNPGDSWSTTTISGTALQGQDIYLQKNRLYSFSTNGSNSKPSILSCLGPVRQLGNNNNFNSGQNVITFTATTTKANLLFNSMDNTKCTVGGAGTGKVINIRATQIGYQLSQDVDKETCNGAPKFDSGCILFNERKINGTSGLSSLNWNAYTNSYVSESTESCDPNLNNCDTNTLIKVKPDRVCDKWLSCMSKSIDPVTGEETCYALGECDKLGDTGRCQNFVTRPNISHAFASGNDRNTAGYSKLGYYYLANMYEVGGVTAVSSWDFENTSTPMLGLNNGQYNKIVLEADDAVIANKNVAYPAIGQGFLSASNPVTIDAGFKVTANKDYFVNLLVNSNLAPSGARVTIGNGVGTTTTLFTGSDGWQRKVIKFALPSSNNNVKFVLSGENGGQVFFDDINMDPVLKVTDNDYIAKSCRLYPKQDSLTCVSKNQNTVSNGLYGYCLESDPKNSDVCLMWYPIDNVKGQNLGASAGITDTPEYCAVADGGFDFVEYRQGYFISAFNSRHNGGANPLHQEQTSPYPGYTYWLYQGDDGNPGECESAITDEGTPSGSGSWFRRRVYYILPNGYSKKIAENNTIVKDSVASHGTHYTSVDDAAAACSTPANCNDCDQLDINQNQGISSTQNGWYVYDGVTVPGEGPVKILDYRLTASECLSINGEMRPLLPSGKGCLVDVANYKPRCLSSFTAVSSAWVDRILNSNTNNFFVSPFNAYSVNTNNGLFGSRYNAATSTFLGTGQMGAPYSCYGANCKNIGHDSNYGSFPVTLNNQNWITNISDTFNKALDSLSRIFLRFNFGSFVYDYSLFSSSTAPNPYNVPGTVNGKIPVCPSSPPLGPVRTAGSWCAIPPTISNVKLRDSDGHEIAHTNLGYSINRADFYTLSFNVDVDSEQIPIARLSVDWAEGPSRVSVATMVDEKPSPSQTFNFVYFYNPQNTVTGDLKNIVVGVRDNWWFYKCSVNTINDNNSCSEFSKGDVF